mgnify:CR=1 FL=1
MNVKTSKLLLLQGAKTATTPKIGMPVEPTKPVGDK